MIDLYSGQMMSLIGPNFRTDPEVQALSHALQKGVQIFLDRTPRGLVYADVDNLEGFALDLLGAELRVQYYDDSADISIKKALVKNATKWHSKTGTVAAMEELATTVLGSQCRVQEWFEYGGAPFNFRVASEGDLDSVTERIEYFKKLLSKVKNVRSHLENYMLYRTLETSGGSCAGEVSITRASYDCGIYIPS